MWGREWYKNISREDVLSPAMRQIWDHFGQGVVIVDGDGNCCYMNELQRKIDGFIHINIIGMHISDLYHAYEMAMIPTMQCLYDGKPLLKKVYWYKTQKNQIFNSINDFFPLYKKGKIDGVISFTTNIGTETLGAKEKEGPAARKEGIQLYTFEDLIGNSAKLQQAIKVARLAASSDVPVMIWGESGTGKELFAQAMHVQSSRKHKPFVPINCAAIPENLLEGMIFGTTRGAFTDASDKAGLLEVANGGTILFDELNSMPLGLQAKLLRALQEKRVRRLGARTEYTFDVRFISILNENPLHCIEQGKLRSDLYYRLAVVSIEVPPLREHIEDVPDLAVYFIGKTAPRSHNAKIGISEEAMSALKRHSWPGNIRELQHVIEGSLVMLGGEKNIDVQHLPHHFHEAITEGAQQIASRSSLADAAQEARLSDRAKALPEYTYEDMQAGVSLPLKAYLREYETHCIKMVLRATGGNVAKAARILGLKVSTLHYTIHNLGIQA